MTHPGTRFTYPLHGILPVSRTRYIYHYVYVYVYGYVYVPMHLCHHYNHHKHTNTLQSHPLQHTTFHCDPHHRHHQFFWSPFSTQFDSQFLIVLDSIVVLIWLGSIIFLIWFDSQSTYLFMIWVTQFKWHYSQDSGNPTLARVSSKYPNTKILEYSTMMIIEIVFGENTLIKSKNQRRGKINKNISTTQVI